MNQLFCAQLFKSNHFSHNPSQAVADMLRCISDKCDEQNDKCVAEDRLSRAKSIIEWAITVLPAMG